MQTKTVGEMFQHSLDEDGSAADIYQTWLFDFEKYVEASTSDSETSQEEEKNELEAHDESGSPVSLETKLNVDYLIKNCLHKAVASLVDDEKVCAMRSRKTLRLDLLMRWLDKSEFMTAGNISL